MKLSIIFGIQLSFLLIYTNGILLWAVILSQLKTLYMAVPLFLFSSFQRATTKITFSNLLLWPHSLFSHSLLCQTQVAWLRLHILLSGPISGCKEEFLLPKDYSTCLQLQVPKWSYTFMLFCLMYLRVAQTSELPHNKEIFLKKLESDLEACLGYYFYT